MKNSKLNFWTKVYFQVIFHCGIMFSDLGDLEEGNIDSVCYAARERVYYDYPWPLNNMGLKRVGPL